MIVSLTNNIIIHKFNFFYLQNTHLILYYSQIYSTENRISLLKQSNNFSLCHLNYKLLTFINSMKRWWLIFLWYWDRYGEYNLLYYFSSRKNFPWIKSQSLKLNFQNHQKNYLCNILLFRRNCVSRADHVWLLAARRKLCVTFRNGN